MGRSILGVFAGMLIAFILVTLVEILGHRIFPPPPGLDLTDRASMAAIVQSMPLGAMLFVLAAWFLGAGVGVSTAVRVSGNKRTPGLVVGGTLLVLTLYSLWTIPHPVWMASSAVIGLIVITVLAARPSGANTTGA